MSGVLLKSRPWWRWRKVTSRPATCTLRHAQVDSCFAPRIPRSIQARPGPQMRRRRKLIRRFLLNQLGLESQDLGACAQTPIVPEISYQPLNTSVRERCDSSLIGVGATAAKDGKNQSIFFFGYDATSGLGGPLPLIR